MARILIVDDDTAFRESLAEMLGDLGHAVSAAPTVATGLQVLQGGSVDVAIVDLRMPGEDGLAFLRKARGLSRAPCIMLTAYASGSNTIEAMRLGAFDHLTKPIARTSLVEVLERALLSAGQAGSPEVLCAFGSPLMTKAAQ
jgi:DNA-binding NtrC family response regulator